MRFEDWPRSFELVINEFVQWLDCIRKPNQTAQRILDSSRSDNENIARVLRMWLLVSSLTLILQLPMYAFVGIDVADFGFHLPNFLFELMVMMVIGASMHAGLRILKHPSVFSETLVMYTVAVGSFAPFSVLLLYPAKIEFLMFCQSIKGSQLTLQQFFQEWGRFSQPSEQFNLVDSYIGGITPLMGLGGGILLLMFARMVSGRYEADNYKTISAIGFASMVVSILPMLALWALYGLMVLSFVV